MADQFNTLDNILVGITDGTLSATIRNAGSDDALNVAVVDGSGNQITSFGGVTQYAEDDPTAGGDLLTMAGVVRTDTAPASLVGNDGDRTQLQVDAVGALWVNGSPYQQPVSNASLTAIDTNLGAQGDSAASSDIGTFSLIALIKRALTHLTLIVANSRNGIASALTVVAQTATQTGGAMTNLSAQGAHFIIDVTANSGAISITPKIQAQDVASTKWYDLLVGKAITTLGTSVIKVHPGLPGTANISADDGLPITWRAVVTHNNGNSVTYTVGANYLE